MIAPSIRQMTASDGYRFHFRHWAVRDARGIVIAVHGIQSHSGWYEYSSRRIAEAGFSVYFADRRGSGLNGRDRGHATHGMRLVNDVRALSALAKAESAATAAGTKSAVSVPVTLLGMSWGGKIAAATAAMFPREFARLALLYPGIEPRLRFTLWQRFRLHMARNLELVRRHIPIPLDDPAMFTQVPDRQQFIAEDPLALHTVSSSLLNAGRDLDKLLHQNSAAITHPVLLMLAGRDLIIDNDRVRRRVAAFGSRSVTTRLYADACHTLEFEPDRENIFDDLLEWLQLPSTNPVLTDGTATIGPTGLSRTVAAASSPKIPGANRKS